MNRGKWVILAIFGLAIALAVVAWNYQRLRGRRVLAYYGNEAALLIRLAPYADLWELSPSLAHGAITQLRADFASGDAVPGARHVVLSHQPGWTHARQALIEDRSYDWKAHPTEPANWVHLIRFRQDDLETILLLDLHRGLVRSIEREESVVFNPKMTAGFRQYLREVLPPEPAWDGEAPVEKTRG